MFYDNDHWEASILAHPFGVKIMLSKSEKG